MTAVNYKRFLKGKLQDLYMRQGFLITTTESNEIILFSDKPLNKKSYKYDKQKNLKYSFLTSFGTKETEKILGNN
jgi:hypothetical protein